ncbi:MAG: hypothetical protein HYX59_02335 [Elusimicrobia bacterium]|nr:hypothetical protein [Elusimicrobiota bacterium]
MPTPEQYRTALEAAIRRLHVAGHTNFYVQRDPSIFHDTNIKAWIMGQTGNIGLPDADLAVQDDEGRTLRAYLIVIGNVGMLENEAQLRLQRLRGQLAQLGVPDALCILTQGSEATVPEPVPDTYIPQNMRGTRVERISFHPSELVLDYLRMAKINIFNSSNTPAAPSLIAEGLGLPEAGVIEACETLHRTGRLELINVGSRRFYRIP